MKTKFWLKKSMFKSPFIRILFHGLIVCVTSNIAIYTRMERARNYILFWRFYFYSNSFYSQWQESKDSSIIKPVTVKEVYSRLPSPETSLQWGAPQLSLLHSFLYTRLSEPCGCVVHENSQLALSTVVSGGNRTRSLSITSQRSTDWAGNGSVVIIKDGSKVGNG